MHRRRSGHAVLMEIYKKTFTWLYWQGMCDASTNSVCTAQHAGRKCTAIVKTKAGIDCDAAAGTTVNAHPAHGQPERQTSITLCDPTGRLKSMDASPARNWQYRGTFHIAVVLLSVCSAD